jgi:competence protein ComEC
MAAGLAAGIALAPAVPLPWPAAASATLLGLVPPLAPLSLLAVGLASRPRPSPLPSPEGDAVVEGRVASVPERLDGRARFLLLDAAGRRLELTAPQPSLPLAWGDRIRVAASLRRAPPPANPGGRDRRASADARGIALEGFAREAPVRVRPPSPLVHLEVARSRFAAAADAALPPREAALVRALGAGDENAVDPPTMVAFARSGLVHLLSVGGLHLAVVAFGAQRLLRRLLDRWDPVAHRIDPRRWSAAAALPVTALYALATGAEVPMLRSAVGAAAAFAGVLLDREIDASDALALASLAILAVDPAALLDVSFQLSFASVAGLAVLGPRLRRAIPWAPGTGHLRAAAEAAIQGACASAAATLATAPLVALHFRRLSLLAVPANLIGVPLGAALTVVAALAGLASAASAALCALLLQACRPLAWALLALGDLFATPGWSSLGLASPGTLGAAACFGLGAGSLAVRGRLRWALALGAAAALLGPGPMRAMAARRAGLLEVVFLSVGQGDAAVVRLPDGSAVLIDCGGEARGRYDPGERDVLPFLRDAGIRGLAAAFVTHPHPDHLLGLPAVADAIPVERLFTSGRTGDEAARAALARLPPSRVLSAGDLFERDQVRFEVLGPPNHHGELDDNDASLVLRIVYGSTSFLFLADVGAAGEQGLLERGGLASTVAKVPHHGSRHNSSAALVEAVRPRWAVVSVGARNRFGFPHPEAVARWRSSGAEVLRTDEGAVRFLSDGRAVRRAEPAAALDALARWGGR